MNWTAFFTVLGLGVGLMAVSTLSVAGGYWVARKFGPNAAFFYGAGLFFLMIATLAGLRG